MNHFSAQRLMVTLGSMRAAVILMVAVGIAVPNGLSFYNEKARLQETYRKSLLDEVAHSSSLVAVAMREPMWQFAPDQAQSIIEATFLDQRVLKVEVFEPSGKVFARRSRPAPDGELTLQDERPVERDGRKIGLVMVEMSAAGYRTALEAALTESIRRGAITLTVSLLLIVMLLQIRLVYPIRRLVEDSARLAEGELDRPIVSSRGDEVGALAQSLESTRQALAKLFSDLREANETLERRVVERTAELESAVANLQRAQDEIVESEKLASLGRVVAGVSHELNTPIGNALTVASTINDALRPLIVEIRSGNVRRSSLNALLNAEQGLDILMRNLEKAAVLIGDFKQVAVDQTSEQRRTFDLARVTEEVLNTLQPALRKSGHPLHRELAPDIECDSFPGPYGQVLSNLVMNALIHAFPDDRHGSITVTVEPVGAQRTRLIVSDNGVGMSDDVRRRIFDPFFTTRMGSGGSGLGMNIAQGFSTRVLGGTLRVDSNPGGGTRMVVEFPRIAPASFVEPVK